MRILAVYIPEEDWPQIEPLIDCEDWRNPMEEEYVFFDPSQIFEYQLRLRGYTLGAIDE